MVEVDVLEGKRRPVEVLGMEAVVAGAMAEVLEGIGGRRGVPATRVDANQPVVGILGGTKHSPHHMQINLSDAQVPTSCSIEGTWPT